MSDGIELRSMPTRLVHRRICGDRVVQNAQQALGLRKQALLARGVSAKGGSVVMNDRTSSSKPSDGS